MRQTCPSTSTCMPFLNWLVETCSATADDSRGARPPPAQPSRTTRSFVNGVSTSGPSARHDDEILDPDAAEPGKVDARLDRDDVRLPRIASDALAHDAAARGRRCRRRGRGRAGGARSRPPSITPRAVASCTSRPCTPGRTAASASSCAVPARPRTRARARPGAGPSRTCACSPSSSRRTRAPASTTTSSPACRSRSARMVVRQRRVRPARRRSRRRTPPRRRPRASCARSARRARPPCGRRGSCAASRLVGVVSRDRAARADRVELVLVLDRAQLLDDARRRDELRARRAASASCRRNGQVVGLEGDRRLRQLDAGACRASGDVPLGLDELDALDRRAPPRRSGSPSRGATRSRPTTSAAFELSKPVR